MAVLSRCAQPPRPRAGVPKAFLRFLRSQPPYWRRFANGRFRWSESDPPPVRYRERYVAEGGLADIWDQPKADDIGGWLEWYLGGPLPRCHSSTPIDIASLRKLLEEVEKAILNPQHEFRVQDNHTVDRLRQMQQKLLGLLPWPVTVESRRARANLTPEQLVELAKDPMKWYEVPVEKMKDVFAKMWECISRGLEHTFIPLTDALDRILVKLPSLESLKAPLWKLIMALSGGIIIQPDRAAGVIFNYIKPTVLTMIIQQHKNTRKGWLATLTALIEVYSSVLGVGSMVVDFMTKVSEYLYTLATSTWRTFKQWWAGLNVPQAGATGAVVLAGIFGFLYYLCTQTTPGKTLTTHFLKAAGIVSGATAAVKSIQWLQEYFRQARYNAKVQMYMTRHSALMEVIDAKDESGTIETEGFIRCCNILVEEGTSLIQEHPTSATAGLLRSYVSALEEKLSQLTQTIRMDKPRPVPQMWVFGGRPGIGKTKLVEHIAQQLGLRTSTFSTTLDHHDSYTGNPIAIWDEFDVDKKADFIETVISMVNSSVFPLNCDRPENKGKVFTSKYILATTNCATPVLPTHPRAHAFWRRVNFVDVIAPEIDSWCARYPGREIPKNLFKPDFSHLELRLRPFMGVDPDGNLADGRRAAVARISVGDVSKLMKNKFEAQAGNPHILWIKMPPNMITEATLRIGNWLKFSSSLAQVVTNVTEAQIQFKNGTGFIVCSDKDPPPGDIVDISVDSFRQNGPPLEECNNLQDLFYIVNGRIPAHVLRSILYEVHGHTATIHDQTMPISKVPRPKYMVTVTYPGDLLAPLWKHLSLSSIPGLWKLLRGYFNGENYFSLLSNVCESLKFSPNPECTLFRTPSGDIILYTCGGSVLFGTPARYPLVNPANYPELRNTHPNNSSWFDLLITFFQVLSAAVLPYLPLILTAVNLSYLTNRADQIEEGKKGKTKRGRGRHAHALNDDEYEEWRDLRKDWRNEMTAQEFMEMRAKANAGGMDQNSQRYRAWLQLRELRAANGAYRHVLNTVIGKGGVRDEVHRVDMMRAPLRAIEEDIEPEAGDSHLKEFTCEGDHVGWGIHIGGGRVVTCTHVARTATEVDGSPFSIQRIQTDLAYVTTNLSGPFKPIGKGVPSFYLDTYNPVRILEEGTFETPTTTVQGWTVKILNNRTTKRGDCGLPYYNLNGQLVGLHAGSSTEGGVKLVIRLTPENTPTIDTFSWKGLIVERGPNVGGMPTGTRYHRSPAFPDMLPTETHEPAPFGTGDTRYTFSQVQMMTDALKPYQQTDLIPFDPVLLQRGVDHTRVALRSLIGTHVSKNLSFHDACHTLERSTSCGPFVPGVKSDYWDEENECYTGELHRHLESAWDAAKRGQVRPNAYKLALKDELRPKEKNAQGKRRLLWGADAGVTLLAAAVLKPVAERLAECVPINPIAVGTNMDSPSVEQMNAALVNRVVYNVDFSKWDSTMQPPIISAAIQLLCEWCEPTVLTSVVSQILVSPARGHFEDVVFTTKTGLPSGMPFTSVVNSVCHMILLSMSILGAYEQFGLPYNGNVFENEVIWTYGDDGLYGFTMATASLMDTIVANMKKFGLHPTGVDKSEKIEPTVTPVFLKREFKSTPNGVRAVLDKTSILRQFFWVKSQRTSDLSSPPRIDRDTRTVQLTVALAMASQHGSEFYEEVAAVAQKVAAAEGLVLMIGYEESNLTYQSWYIGKSSPQQPDTPEVTGQLVFEMEGGGEPPAGGASAPPVGTANDSTAPNVPTGAMTTTPATQLLEMMANTGAGPTTIPMEVQRTFAVVGNLTWTNRQSINTLLGSFSLGPQVNPYLRHLSAMWGAWGGGMDFRFSISGSGMYAGRLMIALVPPGIDPTAIRNPGALPHAMLDARLTEPVVFSVPDVRATNYHTMNDPGDVPSLGLWVFNPLINPFSSNDVISSCTITAESRPSMDFCFGMLLPPSTADSASHSPSNLLPRRLGFSRGNRVGGRVTGAVVVASASQVNHHWSANGTTFGWSLGPVDLVRLQTTTTAAASVARTVRAVDAPLITGVPNHWPDFAASQLISNTSSITTNGSSANIGSILGAAAPALSANGETLNTDMTTARCLLLANGTIGSSNAITLAGSVDSTNLLIVTTNTTATLGGGEWVANRMLINGTTPTVGSTALSLSTGNRVVGPIGTNNILLWQEQCWSDANGMGSVACSQLEVTSDIFSQGPVAIPPNMFAVFSVSSSGGDWQIGITSEGYCYTGAAVGNSILLSADTSFTFIGLFPYNTLLQGFSAGTARAAY
uniref:Genome polyprotein n=1 Tax=Rousettus bat calicivirus TaxID=3141901 RepID=A0AAU7E3B4_9CALI